MSARRANLWAKTEPFHPLICHMTDTGTVAEALLRDSSLAFSCDALERAIGLPDGGDLVNWLCLLSALHDIGKCDWRFQMKAPELVRERWAGEDRNRGTEWLRPWAQPRATGTHHRKKENDMISPMGVCT